MSIAAFTTACVLALLWMVRMKVLSSFTAATGRRCR